MNARQTYVGKCVDDNGKESVRRRAVAKAENYPTDAGIDPVHSLREQCQPRSLKGPRTVRYLVSCKSVHNQADEHRHGWERQ